MLPYWLLFGFFAAGALGYSPSAEQRNRPAMMLWVGAILLIVMIGMRYDVGTDWDGYELIYQWIGRFDLGRVLTFGDPAFHITLWYARTMGWEIWIPNTIFASLFVIGLIEFARRQPNPWLAVAVAVPYLVIVVAMSGVRQATAIGFLFLSLVAFSENRPLKFGLWVVVASLFHASAILMLGIGALSYTRNRLQSGVLIVLLVIFGYSLLQTDFAVYSKRYLDSSVQSGGTLFRVVMNLIPALIYLRWRKQFGAEKHEAVLWRNLAILGVLSLPLLALIPSSTAVDRLGLYIIPLQMYVFSRVPQLMTHGRDARLMTLVPLGYYALSLFVFLNFATHADEWLPYQFYPIFA